MRLSPHFFPPRAAADFNLFCVSLLGIDRGQTWIQEKSQPDTEISLLWCVKYPTNLVLKSEYFKRLCFLGLEIFLQEHPGWGHKDQRILILTEQIIIYISCVLIK